MKIRLVFFALLLLSSGNLWSQDKVVGNIPMIGDVAPSFTAQTTNGLLNFPGDYGRSWKIIFSHPRDFTPVCSTEILTLANMQNEFDKLNVKLVIVSTDTLERHLLWKKDLESLSYKNNAPVKIKFPLIDDNRMVVSRAYGMLHLPASTTKDVRGVFIINPQNKIEAIYFYPMNIGRNMEEIKRTVIALQTASGTGKDRYMIPANWKEGDDVLVPQFPYTEKELAANPSIKNSYYNVGTFMWFKKMK
ncbi:MAG: redoxin domain-containing protein [Bacteroidia bacterium]|nr:redoxin domain-containing protein [Bacteroidia bacterium]